MGDRGVSSGMKNVSNDERKAEAKIKKRDFQEFYDESDNGSRYNGSGAEQEEFFNKFTNFNELIEKMSDEERTQFDKWARGGFMHGEGFSDWNNMPDNVKEAIKTFDKYLDQSVVNKSFVVSRLATAELLFGEGNKVPTSLEAITALRGKIIESLGNMSTGAAGVGLAMGSQLTTNPSIAKGKSVEYHIHFRKGSKGAGMWIGDYRVNPQIGNTQREFMTNRNIRLRVGKSGYDKDRDVYVVNLLYEGRLPHKYN